MDIESFCHRVSRPWLFPLQSSLTIASTGLSCTLDKRPSRVSLSLCCLWNICLQHLGSATRAKSAPAHAEVTSEAPTVPALRRTLLTTHASFHDLLALLSFTLTLHGEIIASAGHEINDLRLAAGDGPPLCVRHLLANSDEF